MNARTYRPPPRKERRHRTGVLARLRRWFIAGVLISAPIAITVWLVLGIVEWIDETVTNLLPPEWVPNQYLPITVPGVGVIVVLIGITLIGAMTTGFIGRMFVRTYESLLARMPIVRSVYSFLKQVFEMVFKGQNDSFRQVVLFEYPRRGSWALGFITGVTEGEIQNQTADRMVNVFLPTTPNPTSGYLLFIPETELVYLSMTVEEGIKMVVSGGMVTPEDMRSAEEQAQPTVPPGGSMAGGEPGPLKEWDRPTAPPQTGLIEDQPPGADADAQDAADPQSDEK